MLGKTLMLGVISASAALGIVYFGTAPQGSQAAEAHPHDDVKVENATKSPKETARERIEPRLPTVRKAEPDNREKLASNDGVSAASAVEFSDTAAQDMNNAMDRSAIREKMPKNKAKGFVYKNQEAPSDATPLLSTVMAEAEQIKKPELRDQAYFEITEYALSEGRYESARAAHDMIAQEELSYTAKSRIAVAFAQNGMPTKAFKVIEEVDEPELRDFMRLQVIEALIAPQNLPETWQEKNN